MPEAVSRGCWPGAASLHVSPSPPPCPGVSAEASTIAGVASALAMALIGAVSSYISYQQKKFCFSIQRKCNCPVASEPRGQGLSRERGRNGGTIRVHSRACPRPTPEWAFRGGQVEAGPKCKLVVFPWAARGTLTFVCLRAGEGPGLPSGLRPRLLAPPASSGARAGVGALRASAPPQP